MGEMLTDTYTQAHIKRVLQELGVSICSESHTDFLCFCPFHGNRNTPSFSVSYSKGLYLCFNPACDVSGTVLDMVKELSHRNDFEALRFIQNCKVENEQSFEDELASLLEDRPEFEPFPQDVLDRMHEELVVGESERALDYLHGRNINNESIEYFRIGYSAKQSMIIVPVHSPDGTPVGLVGRGLYEKRFKNSKNLPRSKTMFNLHRAKRVSSKVVVVESSFDAIRVHQAGFPNVIATLGGFISNDNLQNLNKYFTSIILMTDFDDSSGHIINNCRKCYPKECAGHNPGRDLGLSIAQSLRRKEILWAINGSSEVYPRGCKDVGELTDDEIRHCIKNAVSDVEYSSLNLY